MNTDSKSLLQRYFDAFNSGKSQEMLDCLSDDVMHDVNQGERGVGKAKFAEFLAHMDRCYQEQLKDIVLMSSADGTRGSAEFTVHGTYKADDEGLPPARGQTYVLPAGSFFTIANGKIARVTTYYNLKSWIEQVGG
jgi:steroid delta-isomerase-like uncharacterized protein